MSTLTVIPPYVLADRLGHRTVVKNIAFVVGGAALTAGAAQVSIPMWPVPITGQTFAVLLVGTTLGLWRGLASMLVYLAAGMAGLPVFAGGVGGLNSVLSGPTVGYLIGFVFAGAVTGLLAQRGMDRSVRGAVAIFLVGEAVIYVFGLPWLWFFLTNAGYPNDLMATLNAGLFPFLIGDAVKAGLAGALLPLAWRIAR